MPEKEKKVDDTPVEAARGEMEVKGDLVLPDHAEGGKEIEIKFVITELPDDILGFIQSGQADCAVISQGYVNAKRKNGNGNGNGAGGLENDSSAERIETIRLREMWYPREVQKRKSKFDGSVTHRLTNKGPVDQEAAQEGIIDRNEQELGDAEGEAARRKAFRGNWEKTKGHRVRKVRYFVQREIIPGMHVTLEIDFFLGHLKGLALTEIEFKNRDEAKKFLESPDRPKWLSKQVKDKEIDRFGNAALARKGLPGAYETFAVQAKIAELAAELPIKELLDERNEDMKKGLLIDTKEF